MTQCTEWSMTFVEGIEEQRRVDCELEAPHPGEKHFGVIEGQPFEWWRGTSEMPEDG